MQVRVTTEKHEKATVPTAITLHLGNRILGLLAAFRRWRDPAEHRAYWESKWVKEDRAILLERAKMNVYQWNTGVVRDTPSTPPHPNMPAGPDLRILVGGSLERDWGDCVGVAFFRPSDKSWSYAHFSPARARLIAAMLVEKAEALEEREDCFNIDGSGEKTAT